MSSRHEFEKPLVFYSWQVIALTLEVDLVS